MKKIIPVTLMSFLLVLLFASTTFAHYCNVADKPKGAGAFTPGDIQEAGNSGNYYAPGAFVSLSPDDPDYFVRGNPDNLFFMQSMFQGHGQLPEQPISDESSAHGIVH